MLVKIEDPVGIYDYHAAAWKTFNQLRKEFMHIQVPSQARTDHPRMNSLLPGFNLLTPILKHSFLLRSCILHFLLRDE